MRIHELRARCAGKPGKASLLSAGLNAHPYWKTWRDLQTGKIGSHRHKASERCRPCPEDVYSMTSWMRKTGLVWRTQEIKTHSLDFHFHNKPAHSFPVLHFFNLQNEAVVHLLKWQSAAFLAWPVTPNEYPAPGIILLQMIFQIFPSQSPSWYQPHGMIWSLHSHVCYTSEM